VVPRRLDEKWDDEDEELAQKILPRCSEGECKKDAYGRSSCAGKDLLRLLLRQRLLLEQESLWRMLQTLLTSQRSIFAGSCKLSGCMTPELADCILEQSIARLQYLELHNVLQ
jgi:hypothetical protein